MVISSLIVEAMPERVAAVADALSATEGVEVHGVDEGSGKVVVTIEAASIDASHAVATGFIGVEGVLGISLVYANFEDENLAPSAPAACKGGADGSAACAEGAKADGSRAAKGAGHD